jgi:hypothetical protein
MGFRRNEVVAIEKPADRTAWKGSGVATDSGSLSQNLSPLAKARCRESCFPSSLLGTARLMVSTANRVLSSGDGCPAGVDSGVGVELGAGRGRSPCHRPYFFSVPVFVRYFIRPMIRNSKQRSIH